MFTPNSTSDTTIEASSSHETRDPRALLWQLEQDNPTATDDELRAIFHTRVLADQEYLAAVINYFFDRVRRKIKRKSRPNPERVRRHKEKQQKAAAVIKEKIASTARKIVLMDLLLPHGKTLAESTGKECKMLGPLVGKWLSKIGALVPAKKQVGKTLTEKKVHRLWQAASHA